MSERKMLAVVAAIMVLGVLCSFDTSEARRRVVFIIDEDVEVTDREMSIASGVAAGKTLEESVSCVEDMEAAWITGGG